MLSLESPQARAQREAREAAQEAAAHAQQDADREAAREAALEEAARAQASCPPLSYDAWHSSIDKNLSRGYKYFLQRIQEGGDRHNLVEFYDGARIFNPACAKTLSDQDAFVLIEKLGNYPTLRVVGDGSIIAQLKRTWKAYKEEAIRVETDFGKDFKIEKDRRGITTWHYRWFLRLGLVTDEVLSSSKVWWEACELCALVVPTSGAVERVFSFLNRLFTDEQTRTLSDALKLSLYLAYNHRDDED